MKEGDFKTAEKSYQSAIKEKSELPSQVFLNLAHAAFELGKKAAAKKNYLSVLAGSGPAQQKSNACLQLGNLSAQEKNYPEALEWYKKSLLLDPENQKARKNYELAWKLKKQKEEEENKQNQDKQQNQENQNNPENKSSETNSTQKQSNRGKDPKTENKDQENKKEKEQGKGNGDKNNGKDAQQQKDALNQKSDEPGKDGEQSNPENEGDLSKNKTTQSNFNEPDAYRVDKQKLRESGLSEEQARNMLQAMRQSEIKYLQQRKFRGKNNSPGYSGQRW